MTSGTTAKATSSASEVVLMTATDPVRVITIVNGGVAGFFFIKGARNAGARRLSAASATTVNLPYPVAGDVTIQRDGATDLSDVWGWGD